MKDILIAFDLDNTLIHSYKHKRDGDVCIEHKQDAQQGFMNREALELLPALKACADFIPVTTRSIEQYRRIEWIDGAEPEYAVTTNGAILLRGDKREELWDAESFDILSHHRAELDRMLSMLEKEDIFIRLRKVDEMYIFAYCKEEVSAADKAGQLRELTGLDVECSGKKIYILPPKFNKGEALKRLRKAFSPRLMLAAGDSEIDIPMLEAADLAYCKDTIIKEVDNGNKRAFSNEQELLRTILRDVRQSKFC